MAAESVVEKVLGHGALIKAAAGRYGLYWPILAGLVAQESQGQAWASRPEPRYRWLFGDDAHERRRLKLPRLRRVFGLDAYEQRISYGLCQVMLAVAREYGFGGWPCELCRPETGLKYGAMHLAAKMRQAGGDTTKALLLYNGGGDKAYPAKVLAWAELIGTAMQLKGV